MKAVIVMWEKIFSFIGNHWVDLSLIFVGTFALVIYYLQERRKVSEAASLISMQVEDLQKRISEIGTFVVEGQLNEGAFYESQILFKTDYWDMYKHYFVRKMDSYSFSLFDDFYNCASEILEQQQLMKNLQKNSFFINQQNIVQMESNALLQSLSMSEQTSVDISQLIKAMESTIPADMEPEQKKAVENALRQMCISNSNINNELFWRLYNKTKGNIRVAIDQNAFTSYIPMQIRITLENALKKNTSIPIIGCEGYRKIKKIAKRKF